MRQRVVVIGLGIFGLNIVRELHAGGVEVIAIDKSHEAVQRMRDCCTKAIQADGTDRELLEELGIQPDDVAIVSFGDDLAAATLTTLHLKQLKVRTIIVKAPNEEHRLILEKIGATEVLIPEKEIAHKVAKSLISPNMLDYLPLSDDFIISEIAPPNHFLGRTIAQLQLRSRHHLNVIAVKDMASGRVQMVPGPDFVVKDGDVLVVVGREDQIRQIR
jgi:trk system potassium uptake protein TrkA